MTLAFSGVFLWHLFCSSSASCADTKPFLFILIWQEDIAMFFIWLGSTL
jgi:uncharacterized membrane protein